jgi:DNA-binding Xre family transcriptional regulator
MTAKIKSTTKAKTKPLSTFDKMMQDPNRRHKYEEGYREFLLSELLVDLMNDEALSVRKLAKDAGLSTAIVQGIRSGERKNVTLNSVGSIFQAMGWKLVAKKGRKELVLA